MRYFIKTLGCTKNEFDSSVIEAILRKDGFSKTEELKEAELVILNTCCFIKEAIDESKETALKIERLRKRDSYFVLTGCLVNYFKEKTSKVLGCGNLFVPIHSQQIISSTIKNNCRVTGIYLAGEESHPSPAFFCYETNQQGNVATLLKVAEGCSNLCTYCAIPAIRGKLKSIPSEMILNEAEKMLEKGAKELTIIAQDLASYGKDLENNESLEKLIEKLSNLAEKITTTDGFWLRLLYLNPDNIDVKRLESLFSIKGVVPYFDIPVQTGSDRVRQLMGRRKPIGEINELFCFIRENFKDASIRTSVLVGFPGEEESDLEETISFLSEVEPDYCAVFQYSKMRGTTAYNLKGQLSGKEKAMRAREVQEIVDGIARLKAIEREGKETQVLIERVEESVGFGRHLGQALEIDGETYIKGFRRKLEAGKIEKAVVLLAEGYDYTVELIE